MKKTDGSTHESAELYTVAEIADKLAISLRSAYNLCQKKSDFKVIRIGRSIRIKKESFDAWYENL